MNQNGHKIVRRSGPDRAQAIRLLFQGAFLLLNLWIGAQFYLWVRYFETGGAGWKVSRPPGVEGWLPIASLMSLKAWLSTGTVPAVHPAGLFLFIAFLLISLVLSRSFCSWLCPVGTLSEALYKFGRRAFGRNLSMPAWLDLTLRATKYLLLAFFLWVIGRMSGAAIEGFLEGPYGIVADVKMLNFFRDLSLTAALILVLLVILSALFKNFWCRYACPYGALMGLLSLLSPARIRRDPGFCIDCAQCARVCPSRLPVDKLRAVRSAECTGCYECVSACPVEGALAMRLGRTNRLRPAVMGAAIAAIFLAFVAIGRLTRSWEARLPDAVYFELVPRAADFSHP
jgi:polyferredoxin